MSSSPVPGSSIFTSSSDTTDTPQAAKNLAPAVMKAAQILDVFAQSNGPISLAELARTVDLPKSTLHTLCNTLVHLRLLHRLDTGQMSFGPHVMTWANAFLSRSDVTQEFFSVWNEVNVLPQETITLSVLDGGSVIYIACRNGNRPLGVTFRIGMRLPAPYTATGKAMLSTWPEHETRALYAKDWPQPLTPAGTPNLAAFLDEMNKIRDRGFSVDDGEVREGMHCFGAPVFDSTGGRAVAGVAVSMLSQEITPESELAAGNAIRLIADRLSQRLGANIR
ncbi:IclR family transcriptional regulator [Burkholderia sp. LMU1-1-1.1]|uniref:IclR family transcriptional regulator n=1 Tax=Burkholderia sp. LMU1-1-1.1 TaxID=3135266 RepID=UPI00343A941A